MNIPPVNPGGTVTTVSVVSANGFGGTVATATATPAITLTTSVTGLLKGNGTGVAAAVGSDVPNIAESQVTGLVADLAARAPGGLTGQMQYNTGSGFGGTAAVSYATSGHLWTATAQAIGDVPVTVKAASGQTGHLVEVQDSTGALLWYLDRSGTENFGPAANATFKGQFLRAGSNSFLHNAEDWTSVYLGVGAGSVTSTGSHNVAVGAVALPSVTTGTGNAAIGVAALSSLTTGSNNFGIGSDSLFALVDGGDNVAVGDFAGFALVHGSNNVMIGHGALPNATSASSLVAIGTSSLGGTPTTSVAVGDHALGSASNTGDANVAVGYQSGQSNTSGSNNAFLGRQAGSGVTTGSDNTAVGGFAWSGPTTGSDNTAVGCVAGNTITTGSNNTFLGSSADATSGTLTNATAIGYNAKVANSNTCVIGAGQSVVIGSSVLATSATHGFLYLPTCAGTPTGVPDANTGTAPAVFDTTGGKLWLYNGAWASAAGGSGANPTASVGLSAVNGSAATFLRSDGAPALDQTITPTWTGVHTYTPAARTSGSAAYHVVNAPADTTLTASAEAIGVNFVGATRQHATGAITTQREVVIGAPTYSFPGASTITTAATLAVAGAPAAGTNAAITNAYSFLTYDKLGVRLTGGTAGRDEFVVYHDGVNVFLQNRHDNSAAFTFNTFNNGCYFAIRADLFRIATAANFGWVVTGSADGNAIDAGFVRLAPKVVGTTGAVGAPGWLQNSAGRARNTADATSVSATPANLSDLSVTLAAGRKYTGILTLFANNSTAAEGLAFDFNGGTATMTSFEAGFAATPPGSGLVLGTLTTTALGTALTATTATTADAVYTIRFALVCNAAGTFIPRFAEVSHTSGTATVRLGSSVWIEDMPN